MMEPAMEFFEKAQVIRLRSHHDKFLIADDDEETVSQDRNGIVVNAKWVVEIVENANCVRLKSCYGKYLTASNMPFLLGMTGKKVLQTLPRRLDSSVEWEPLKEGAKIKLKTRYGQYLRANAGLPPWRNHITHDIPHRTSTQDWILWEIDIVEIRRPDPLPCMRSEPSRTTSFDSESPTRISLTTAPTFSRTESDGSIAGIPPPMKNEGRLIHYTVANDKGFVDESEKLSFTFKGSEMEELKLKLEEETGLDDILVCSQNPLNGKLYPLRLHLPPNNTSMDVVVVPSSGKEASNIANPES
ncbi:hypothetical protein JCGZ_09710 [Jatropha curcas]|uniref:Uncharacterized protein n=1 Tax=Jatropha curcas TaxID=180498 RepID=A0A067LAH1_JATCU|nr:hypothetical protein JCGZ_09710 [Jatropha curcas]